MVLIAPLLITQPSHHWCTNDFRIIYFFLQGAVVRRGVVDPEDTRQAIQQFKKACRSATLNGTRGPGGDAFHFLDAEAEDLTTAVVQNSPFGGCNALGHQVLKLGARTVCVSFQSNELWHYVAMIFISVASTPPYIQNGRKKVSPLAVSSPAPR